MNIAENYEILINGSRSLSESELYLKFAATFGTSLLLSESEFIEEIVFVDGSILKIDIVNRIVFAKEQ